MSDFNPAAKRQRALQAFACRALLASSTLLFGACQPSTTEEASQNGQPTGTKTSTDTQASAEQASAEQTSKSAQPTLANIAPARLPQDSGPYYPSLMRLDNTEQLDVQALADVQACISCHKAAGEQWAHSAHAHASFDNPWYRTSVDALREEVGFAASRHCGGCHDPLLLLSGKMDAAIEPSEPLADAGITCLVCHSATAAAADGNAALTLTTTPVPIPTPGDDESLRLHRERLASPTLRSPALCGNCHRGFLGKDTGNVHHIFGMDTPGAFSASAFAGSRGHTMEEVAQQTCNDCHMEASAVSQEDPSAKAGKMRSHRFAASHTPLAQQLAAPEQQDAIAARLRDIVRIDLPVLHHNGKVQVSDQPLELAPKDKLALDVTVRSLKVGHAFPGGLKDMQDTWIKLVVKDGRGKVVAQSGAADQHHVDADPDTYFLRALVVDASGRAEKRHQVSHFGTVAYDHSVAALGARTVRYEFTLPAGSRGPLRAEVALYHRKHRKELRDAACEATRSARGKAFTKLAKQRKRPVIDGCAAEPVTLLAHKALTLGTAQTAVGKPAGKQPQAPDVPRWERLYDHALGLSNHVQERLDEARGSIQLALEELKTTAPDAAGAEKKARTNLLCLLGRIAARQGRTAEALGLAQEAESAVGEHAAVERVRADAYLQVWRFEEAVAALERLVALSPADTAAHRDLARARLSARDAVGALSAAQSGLKLQPRDESLLRTQAVALRNLGSPEAEAANQAYLRYRQADTTTQAKLACDRISSTCARDRMPVVTIALGDE